MKRYIDYGFFTAAIFTLIYIIAALITGITINIIAILMCVGGGILAGFVLSILLIYFSPGEPILEGEEDNYIKR
ncbi:hypothetical protein EW093_09655 [Thiospirochaeta perfilievii]|uniref:Uncharacterized protein n=1 Tax=Thiospirochaeta perfilievii TaxID=252967 RepID=A0A5C1QBR0_9SPIO|nr:hypothetical protein [Thiospirochaeta perfilievii]QEN04961.1 hypothetical protein EW093_09655 [Thiospirochaeta perfilievii]